MTTCPHCEKTYTESERKEIKHGTRTEWFCPHCDKFVGAEDVMPAELYEQISKNAKPSAADARTRS